MKRKSNFESAKKRGKDKLVISEIPYTMIGNNISSFIRYRSTHREQSDNRYLDISMNPKDGTELY